MEQIDLVCSIVVVTSFVFVLGLVVWGPLYARYRRWKEKRAFRLRDKRDAGLREADRMGRNKERSA
jgi:hypothetical protein